jgi:ribosomal protein S18 acetylase RimI-like enzyme
MTFKNSEITDLDNIFELYAAAVEYQKIVSPKQWQGFDRDMVVTEIQENRQWKIVIDGQIACIFALTFDDKLIWGDRDQNDAIYVHRIVTNPKFRGAQFVKHIVSWAHEYVKTIDKKYIRMDTWGDNQKLIDYYQSCGFEFLGFVTLEGSEGLPAHYSTATLSLFEIES